MRCYARWLALGSLFPSLLTAATGHAQQMPAISASAPATAPPAAPSQSAPPPASAPAPLPSAETPALAPREPVALPLGVLVVAVDDASNDAAWDLASAVYADPLLRPHKLDDATARVLVGDPPRPGASQRQLELSQLRHSFGSSSPAVMQLLASLARELSASAVALVRTDAPDQVHARLFLAARSAFVVQDLLPEVGADLQTHWTATTSWLHSQAARSRPPLAPAPSLPPPARPPGGESFVASGWFWGALVGAAGAAVLVYSLSSHDQTPTSIHLQGRVEQ